MHHLVVMLTRVSIIWYCPSEYAWHFLDVLGGWQRVAVPAAS